MSFPRYPCYKHSGVEWLGEVPAHWECMTLRRCATSVLTGRTPANRSPEPELEDGLTWYTPGDFGDQLRLENSSRMISRDTVALSEAIVFPEGSVLIVSIGATLGKVGFIDRPSSANQQINAVIPNDRLDGLFLANSLSVKSEYMRYLSNASTIGIMNQEKTKEIWIAVPSLREQHNINAFLDHETAKIDALIAEQRRLINLLKEKRQAVISHAVTKGLNPNAPMKPSGIKWIGDVPEHWNISGIKRFTETITDGAHISPETENGAYPFVSTKDISTESICFDDCLMTSEKSYEYMVQAGCKPINGDVLFSKDGTIGRTVVVQQDQDFVVASSLIIIRPVQSILCSDFLNRLCQSRAVMGQVDCFVKGAGLPRLSVQNLLKVVGCFPPLVEQIAIANYLDQEAANLDALTAEAQRAIDLLQERRTALISAAVTGQIDVRTARGTLQT